MEVTRTLQCVPDLYEITGIAAGNVYIAKPSADPEVFNSDLRGGQKVVLRTQQGETLELTTRCEIGGEPSAKGTYLNAVDLATFNDVANPQMRLYTGWDTFAKVRSAVGVALLLPAVLAVLTAIVGIFFLLSSGASQAQSCQLLMEGHQAPAVTLPKLICGPPTMPWWRSTLTGSLVTGGIAVLTALVGISTLPSHYRFGKKPTSSG
jgi:hypothetical protein